MERPAYRDSFFDLVDKKSVSYAAKQLCKTPLIESIVGEMRMVLVKMGVYDRLRKLKKVRK